jgi:hypothetical protein
VSVYGEFVVVMPVTVTEQLALLEEAVASVQLGVGLNVTPAAELKVTVPVGVVLVLPGVTLSETVTVKTCEPPTDIVAEAGLHDVEVGCFAVRLKSLPVVVLLLATEKLGNDCVLKSTCDAAIVTRTVPLPGKFADNE